MGSPKWSRRESLWLKPDDFSQKALRELEKAISELEPPLSESLEKEIESVKERLPDKLFSEIGVAASMQADGIKNGSYCFAAIYRYLLFFDHGHK